MLGPWPLSARFVLESADGFDFAVQGQSVQPSSWQDVAGIRMYVNMTYVLPTDPECPLYAPRAP